jgi:hypothetical protein
MPRIGLAAVVIGVRRAESGIFEDQDAAITEGDFFGLPGGALVEGVGFRLGWDSRLLEPVQIRLVVGDPFFDRLPRWFDGLHGLIRPPRPAGSPCGLRLRLRPKRFRSLGVFRCRRAEAAAGGGSGLDGRMMRSGMGEIWPRDLLE